MNGFILVTYIFKREKLSKHIYTEFNAVNN